jgi:hypothetical protein
VFIARSYDRHARRLKVAAEAGIIPSGTAPGARNRSDSVAPSMIGQAETLATRADESTKRFRPGYHGGMKPPERRVRA